MVPVPFPESNVTFAKHQPEYQPLPAFRADDGVVVTCWKFSWRELLLLLRTRRIWLMQLTFNEPLQPQLPVVEKPKFQVPDETSDG